MNLCVYLFKFIPLIADLHKDVNYSHLQIDNIFIQTLTFERKKNLHIHTSYHKFYWMYIKKNVYISVLQYRLNIEVISKQERHCWKCLPSLRKKNHILKAMLSPFFLRTTLLRGAEIMLTLWSVCYPLPQFCRFTEIFHHR